MYTDAILHISDYPAFVAWLATVNPDAVDEDGRVTGFDAVPRVMAGDAAMTYVRFTGDAADQWRALAASQPLVTILAEAEYTGDGLATGLAMLAEIDADLEKRALYDAVWPREPVDDYTPPQLFGVIG